MDKTARDPKGFPWGQASRVMNDTVARYDPMEAVEQICQATLIDPKTVAHVLEGEFDYMACLGLVEESDMDETDRSDLERLKRENADIVDASDGEYDTGAAVLFIQRNRGIDQETIARILEANFHFLDERGFLDGNWGEDEDEEP
ncbi:MAG: hypothetical protein HY900_26505 [Deltaproteobacteria bacterium]|nr:hypothetical protein [Deltaproteobacteria bacterium]